jgi:stage II sporulation protein D
MSFRNICLIKMLRIRFILILMLLTGLCSAQVKIRLFTSQSFGTVVFSVKEGGYDLEAYPGGKISVGRRDLVLMARYNEKIALKINNNQGIIIDSAYFTGSTPDASFSLRVNSKIPVIQYYSGDLLCKPDLGTLLIINRCDFEKYIAGVVKAEGGSGKNIEYFKSQAVLARTYMFRYFDKHKSDGYNLCDDVHCQAFNGVSFDTVLNLATLQTRDEVVFDSDSNLIISAFHSNCGGETSPAEYVWLTGQTYLKRVADPFCAGSRSSNWEKVISGDEWRRFLQRTGYSIHGKDLSVFAYRQSSRVAEYRAGSLRIPLTTIRNELGLRSTFFSVVPRGDSLIFRGKGYGHGVGLCQEGAMEMATEGFDYRHIINYYFTGVKIGRIDNRNILTAGPVVK